MDKKSTSLRSAAWQRRDWQGVSRRFLQIGITRTDEILDLRIFDLLNLNRIHAEIAEEMLLLLYRFLNPDTWTDEAMERKQTDQPFSYKNWNKKHKDPSGVTVRDLVLAEDINRKAIRHLYMRILKAFYASDVYDGREYRYLDYSDYLCRVQGVQASAGAGQAGR